ncbi:ribbon-helix-helix protein, CopG family [Hydrogenivirga sp.]
MQRINVSLEEEIYRLLKEEADRTGKSLSSIVRDYIELALAFTEDVGFAEIARERLKTYSRESSKSHEEIWT